MEAVPTAQGKGKQAAASGEPDGDVADFGGVAGVAAS